MSKQRIRDLEKQLQAARDEAKHFEDLAKAFARERLHFEQLAELEKQRGDDATAQLKHVAEQLRDLQKHFENQAFQNMR